jgi:hypothetical protein
MLITAVDADPCRADGAGGADCAYDLPLPAVQA